MGSSLIKNIASAFYAGLTKPSGLSVSLALLTPMIAVAVAVFAGPRLMASDAYVYFMSHAYDTHTVASHRVMKGVKRDKPTAAILGTSVMVYCVSEEPDLNAAMGLGDEFYVASVPTASQNAFEMAAILDRLDPYAGSVVVIGLNPGLFTKEITQDQNSLVYDVVDQPNLAFYSDVLSDEIKRIGDKPPFKTGIYTIDNIEFFMARRKAMIKNVLSGGTPYGDQLDAPWIKKVNKPEFWEEEKAELAETIAAYDSYSAAHFEVLARMIEKANQEPGIEFVIAEAPTNPGWYETAEGRDFFERFNSDLQIFAKKHRATYASLSASARLNQSDFADFEGHLVTHDAQERCTSALGQSILSARLEL